MKHSFGKYGVSSTKPSDDEIKDSLTLMSATFLVAFGDAQFESRQK